MGARSGAPPDAGRPWAPMRGRPRPPATTTRAAGRTNATGSTRPVHGAARPGEPPGDRFAHGRWAAMGAHGCPSGEPPGDRPLIGRWAAMGAHARPTAPPATTTRAAGRTDATGSTRPVHGAARSDEPPGDRVAHGRWAAALGGHHPPGRPRPAGHHPRARPPPPGAAAGRPRPDGRPPPGTATPAELRHPAATGTHPPSHTSGCSHMLAGGLTVARASRTVG